MPAKNLLVLRGLVATTLCMCMCACAAGAGVLAEYSITPSSQVAYYHYEAPRGQQLTYQTQPQQQQAQHLSQVQQQQVARPAPVRYAAQAQPVSRYQAQHPRHYQQHRFQQPQPQPQPRQQQQQPQQQYRPPPPPQPPQQQPQQYRPAVQLSQPQLRAAAKQFASPALENAAFAMALTSQGYVFQPASLPALPPSNAASVASAMNAATVANVIRAASSSGAQSLNVKLPLPFGLTPINVAPLPLQAGAPYSSLPRDVTSYGTKHPQRRRR